MTPIASSYRDRMARQVCLVMALLDLKILCGCYKLGLMFRLCSRQNFCIRTYTGIVQRTMALLLAARKMFVLFSRVIRTDIRQPSLRTRWFATLCQTAALRLKKPHQA